MEKNTAVQVGGQSLTLIQRFTTRRVLIPLVTILVVASGVYISFHLYKSGQQKQATVKKAVQSAQSTGDKGNYQASYDTLKQSISSAQSKADKVQVYNNLSLAAANIGKTQEALDYMIKKHQVDSSTVDADAYTMGEFYEKLGNTPKAIEQYKIALVYAKKMAKDSELDNVTPLEAKIKFLENKSNE